MVSASMSTEAFYAMALPICVPRRSRLTRRIVALPYGDDPNSEPLRSLRSAHLHLRSSILSVPALGPAFLPIGAKPSKCSLLIRQVWRCVQSRGREYPTTACAGTRS
jgi:hypothetical protein